MSKNKKMEEIKELVGKKQYSLALNLLESMDVQTELTEKDLAVFVEVYIRNQQFNKAKALLEVMFKNNATKMVISQLIYVCMIMEDIDDAEKYYLEYEKIAPNDVNVMGLRYRLDKVKKARPETLIRTLEKLEDKSYNDEFAFDLAKLYSEIGEDNKCIKKCNEIIVLSSNKKTIDNANKLKDETMSKMSSLERALKKDEDSSSFNIWKEFKEKTSESRVPDKRDSIALNDLIKEQEYSKNDFLGKTESLKKGNDINNIEAKARLNIELSAKKALEDRFNAIEQKKKDAEYKLKMEQSIRTDLEKKIKNYEVIRKSLEDKINIQDKNKAFLEEQLKKAEMRIKETENKFNMVYEQKMNIENKFNKLDELSKNQSEKLVREVANSRKVEERLSEKEMKVNQLIERLQLEEKTKSQLINNLEIKEKYCENIEARLEKCEKTKADLEVKYTENVNKIENLEQKLSLEVENTDKLNMQLKNLMVEKNNLEVKIRQVEQNRNMIHHNLQEHVKNKQFLENRCNQLMEHKNHIEKRLRDVDAVRSELEMKLRENEQNTIVIEDSLRGVKEEFENFKKQKESEIEHMNKSFENQKNNLITDMTKDKEETVEKIQKEFQEKESELKIEKEQLKRRFEKDMNEVKSNHEKEVDTLKTDYEKELESARNNHESEMNMVKSGLENELNMVKTSLETELNSVKSDLEGKLEILQRDYDDKKERLDKSVEDNKMLDNTLREKISIINSLDSRMKDVITERKRLVDRNKELEHRLDIEISNNKKLDDMVTQHIDGKAFLENEMSKSRDIIRRLEEKNEQGADIIKHLEEKIKNETDNRINCESKLHDAEIRCTNLEKELRELKLQLRQQRDKEISLVEKSGEELLSSAIMPSSTPMTKGIELDDLGILGADGGTMGSPYKKMNTSVSQFLDELVDDMDDFSGIEADDLDVELEEIDSFVPESKPEVNLHDSLPEIDMKAIEAELNLSSNSIDNTMDVDQPAPRLRQQEVTSNTSQIGSFFDSPEVPEYKKKPYQDSQSVVSQLFGSSSENMNSFVPDEDEKKQFYQEIMQSQMFEGLANTGFTGNISNEYKQEALNASTFGYYYYAPFIMDVVQKSVFGIKNNRRNNHIVISGPDYYDKIELAKMLAKQLSEKRVIASNKIARITGEAFNKVDLDVKAPKLLDGTVIIQDAEKVNAMAFEKLTRLISTYEGRIVVILVTSMDPGMLFATNQNAGTMFNGTINLPKYSVDFLLEYVRAALGIRGMGISQEAENELANMFNLKIKHNKIFSLEELLVYVETAIDSAMKRKKGKGKHPTDIIIRQDINTNW